MDRVNPKMGGDFETSIGGKAAKLGDRLANTSVGKMFDRFANWVDKRTAKWAEKNKVVNSLKYHSTSPEWGFAKMPAKGLFGFWATDAGQVLEEYLKPIGKNAQKLEQYALSQKEIDEFVKTLTGGKAERILAIQKKELELLGASQKSIESVYKKGGIEALQKYAQGLKVKDFGIFKGIKDFKEFKAIDHPDVALKIFENLAAKHPNWKISIWRNKTNGILGKISSHLFGRTISFTEYRNKALIATGKGGATRLGRFMSKSLGWIQEGATNRFGGGKVAVLLQAMIFADMAMATIKAPWKEKFQTAVERLVNDFSYFVALTLGILGMHKIGGFKFVGLKDAKDVARYDEALAKFNAKADAGLFKNKKAYKKALKLLNRNYLGEKNIKNPITKLLHKIGKFIDIGNRRVHNYKSNSKFNLNLLRKIKNGNIIGVPLRIWLAMGVAVPFIAKWATKSVHAIIGRPTHSVLDEDEEEPENTQASQQVQPAVQQTGAVSAAAAQTVVQYKAPQDYKSDTNLIKQAMSGKPAFQGSLNSPQDHPTVEDYKKLYQDSNYVKQTLNGQYPPAQGQQAVQNTTAAQINDGVQHPTAQEYQNYPDSNYVKMTLNGQYPPQGNVINNNTTTIVNGQQLNAELEPKRTYIPSPECKITNNVDPTAAEKALADADNAEKFINDTLSKMK